MNSHLSKYGKAIPVLALLFELAENPHPESVSLGAWKMAEGWATYLEGHAQRIYAPTYKPELIAAHKLADRWEDLPGSFTAKNIYDRGWEQLNDANSVLSGLKVLESCGWVRKYVKQTGGRPSEVWKKSPLNPPKKETGLPGGL